MWDAMTPERAFSLLRQKRYTPADEEALNSDILYPADADTTRGYADEEYFFRLLCRMGEQEAIQLDAVRSAAELFTALPAHIENTADDVKNLLYALAKKTEWSAQDCQTLVSMFRKEGTPESCPMHATIAPQDDPEWISVHVEAADLLAARAREKASGKKGKRWLLIAVLLALGAAWMVYGKR